MGFLCAPFSLNGCPRDMRHNSKYHCERGASYFGSSCSIPQMRALPVMPCCAMAVTRYKCTTSLSRRIRPATTNGALGQTAGRRAADAAATLFASLAEFSDERLSSGGIANLGAGDEISKDIASLHPGSRSLH